ncbi:putative ribonuclease H-like domain-containing protein [Tanacetum coccineum]
MTKITKEHGLFSSIHKLRRTNHKDFQNCLFACFLSQMEPKKPVQALKDPSWVEAMQDELLQFKLLKFWTLVDLPRDKWEIGTKWIFRNKKDERGIVVKNKARLVAQGYTQEEGEVQVVGCFFSFGAVMLLCVPFCEQAKWYGYIKNHKKIVKNGQAQTRESEENKKKPKNQRPQSNPNRVEVAWVKTFGKEVEEYVTKVIAKDGTVTRFGGRFPHFIEEEKKPKPYNLYGFVDLMENEQVYAKTGFAPHRIPQSEGNHNGWLSEEEEADSDSESTASNCPHTV